MEIESWKDLIPLLNKGVEDIHGQNWPDSEMVIELKDGSQINFQFILGINRYGICGNIEMTYHERWKEEEDDEYMLAEYAEAAELVEFCPECGAVIGVKGKSVLETHEKMREEGEL